MPKTTSHSTTRGKGEIRKPDRCTTRCSRVINHGIWGILSLVPRPSPDLSMLHAEREERAWEIKSRVKRHRRVINIERGRWNVAAKRVGRSRRVVLGSVCRDFAG